MCGLVGIAGDTNLAMKDGFRDMLVVNQIRGRDSTGVFSVRNNDVSIAKQLGTPEALFDMKSFDSALNGCPKVMAGHGRSKTVGENTRANAHPYLFDNLVGMHNGTLRNYYSWSTYDHKRTDSYALYASISERGLDETFADLDPSGAWALVWWDIEKETLNFIRNAERPLWFAWTQDKRAMVWASEPWFFGAIRRKVDLWDGKDDQGEVGSPYWQLPENQLWSFSVNDRAPKHERTMHLHPIREVKAEGRKVVNFQNKNSYYPAASGTGNRGGSVVNPFPQAGGGDLDDSLDDLPFLPRRKAITSCRVVSPTTSGTADKSRNHSSNVSDFRPGSMRGKNSSRSILSLLSRKSSGCLLDSSGRPLNSCEDYSPMTTTNPSSFRSPLVDIRTVAGKTYVTDNKTSSEWSEEGFEANTGGICTFCKSPVGDLNEVAEFLSPQKFVCTGCWEEPKKKAS